MKYHTILATKQNVSFFVKIQPDNYSANFEVFVKFAERPTKQDYNASFQLPNTSPCIPQIALYESEASKRHCIFDPYTVFLGQDIIKENGTYYIGVLYSKNHSSQAQPKGRSRRSCFGHGRQKRACVEEKDPPPKPKTSTSELAIPQYNPGTDLNYSMHVEEQQCLYWSETKQTWTSDGCKVR